MKKIIVITGPTGVGKTKMSIEIAKKYDGEIINADSMQVYKNLDIATAKITESEKENIEHHLLDIKDINEDYSVFDYQKDARIKIKEILDKNKTPIIVGGTGLYIKAALYNYEFKDEEEVINNYDNLSSEELYKMLKKIDPLTDIHSNNKKRIIRALNYYDLNKTLLSDKPKSDILLYDTIFIGLTDDRNTLYERINKRVDKMIEEGIIEEAKQLFDDNIYTKPIMMGIGYKELYEYFKGEKSLEEAVDKIKQNSRKYAKRQYTFFNHQLPIKWFNIKPDFKETINEVDEYIKQQ